MTAPDDPTGPRPEHPGGPAREALAIVVACLALVGGGAWWLRSPTGDAANRAASGPTGVDPDYSRYVGNASCAGCHPGEAAAHGRSGHAKTLLPVGRSRIVRGLDGKEAPDPERPGVSWAFSWLGAELSLERREGGGKQRSMVEYAFGSGHHATTFVSLVDREPTRPVVREHRLSYYAHSGSLGLTPGQSLAGHATGNSPSGRVHSPAASLKCFECHVTVTSDRGPRVLDEATMIPNVSCERCHGPGRSHVDAARAGAGPDALAMPQGPGRWTAPGQLEQCGQCHRTPEMVQPGSIRGDNPALVRHQPVGLAQSRCYLESRGRLACVSCHDPHARTSKDRSGYEVACLSCHQEPPQTSCPTSPTSGCLDCHMPRREVTRGMIMTDHWIRRSP